MRVVVIGAGIGGLAAALTLGRRGHEVTVVERDDTPMPASPEEAFDWDRRGAPQVRHSHAFLARLRNLLLDHHPDVYAALLRAGATEMRFGDDLPPTIVGFERQPDDDELVMLAARRTTFEWVLRAAAIATDGVTVRTGCGVVGLAGGGGVVTGVVLDDSTTVAADLVVLATGRRTGIDEWLAAVDGQPISEASDDTGIVYLSRFYRLRDHGERPPRSGLIGGDLGYLKYGVFIGDNDTFSVTLAIPTHDRELRRTLHECDTFDTAARTLVAATDWLDGRSVPLADRVHTMAGLVNRWRDFVVDDEPVATGLVPVGDAVLCTNPLYGRGCTTAFWSAELLGAAVDVHADDVRAVAVEYDAVLRREIRPWYRASVTQDAEAKRVAAALLAGDDPDGDTSDPRTFMRAVFRDGLAPAMRTDPVVLRAVMRNLNLLTPPDTLTEDPDVAGRVLAVFNARDERPPEPVLGPRTRAEMLASL